MTQTPEIFYETPEGPFVGAPLDSLLRINFQMLLGEDLLPLALRVDSEATRVQLGNCA